MTRIWSWLGACSILTAGCRFVVSLDGLAGSSAPVTGDGGSAGGAAGAGGASGAGGMGGMGGSATIDASIDREPVSDASAESDRSDGASGPIPIYSAPAGATIRGITVYGSNLYWVEGGSGRGLFRMAKDGTEAPTPLSVTSSATDVAVDATSIYWGDGYEVWQMPFAGTAATMPSSYFALGATTTRYLAVDEQAVVYVSTATTVISGKPSIGTRVPFQNQMGISGIAYFAIPDAGLRDLVWGYASGIRKGPTSGGGAAMDLYTGSTESVQGVAIDEQYMYWISNGRSIKRGTIVGASAVSELCFTGPQDFGGDAGADLFIDLAVDERFIYFTWPAKNQIWKCAKE